MTTYYINRITYYMRVIAKRHQLVYSQHNNTVE